MKTTDCRSRKHKRMNTLVQSQGPKWSIVIGLFFQLRQCSFHWFISNGVISGISICFRLSWFYLHLIVSLRASDNNTDSYSVASQNQAYKAYLVAMKTSVNGFDIKSYIWKLLPRFSLTLPWCFGRVLVSLTFSLSCCKVWRAHCLRSMLRACCIWIVILPSLHNRTHSKVWNMGALVSQAQDML